MIPFEICGPGRILFGRGRAAAAPGLIAGFGVRGVLVHGANPLRAVWLVDALRSAGVAVLQLPCHDEPTLAAVEAATAAARGFGALWVVGLGGGSVLDLAKAVAALAPAQSEVLDHLEIVGRGLPLAKMPLPFIAIPTTAGTGAEATRNAVIGVPASGRKVSLRDDRMFARIAVVDPGLTDHCPRNVTLSSGMDALTQVIEPFVSCKATPFTDAVTRPAISAGVTALVRLMQSEDPASRDQMAWVSLCGGLALSNAGLGAVHGLAGVIGGLTGAGHGAICGALLGPVLQMNARLVVKGSDADLRLTEVRSMLAAAFAVKPDQAAGALASWARSAGLPKVTELGLAPAQFESVAQAALLSSSMRGNPVAVSKDDLMEVLASEP